MSEDGKKDPVYESEECDFCEGKGCSAYGGKGRVSHQVF